MASKPAMDELGRGTAVARAFQRAVADYEIEMRLKVRCKDRNGL